MATCCDQLKDVAIPSGSLTIALAGNPNSGKTTIFNALTGLRQKVGNYPGITVERKVGRCPLPDGSEAMLVDLPGTYSLISRSPDEVVAMEVLRGLRPDTPSPDLVVVVVDASNLQRNLYLVSQIIELGRPMVIALNMMDVAQRRGMTVSPEDLQRELGIPVIPVVGHRKDGIDALRAAIVQARVAPLPAFPLPMEMREELTMVGGAIAIIDSTEGLECAAENLKRIPVEQAAKPDHTRLDRYHAIAERLLVGDRAGDLTLIATKSPVETVLQHAHQRMVHAGIDPIQAEIEAHYRWIEIVAGRCVTFAQPPSADTPRMLTHSEKVDAIFVHRFWGLLIFAVIMGGLFVSIFWLAGPIMDAMRSGIDMLAGYVTNHMADGPLKALLVDGIFAGVGGVVVFVPQIALLFLFLSILEDSGYLARAAFLMDRLLARVGLHGKSFIPLLSSFACAIPGIMATRTIENRKDRLATILVAPFMSCSARLPVYTLLIGAFFASYSPLTKALIMLGLYALGVIAAAICAFLLKRSVLRGPVPAFILELPTYKFPQASQVARQVVLNSWEFLHRAGPLIFAMSIILWALTYYPRLPETIQQQVRQVAVDQKLTDHGVDNAIAAAQREYSLAGRVGHFIEPAIRPLGYDWKIGVGLIGALTAREVFVSTMAITYAADAPEGEGESPTSLARSMRADRYGPSAGPLAGKPVWTPLVAISVLVWFVLAMQCMSTLAVVRRETMSWRWPLFMLAYMNVLAYLVCFILFQVGSRIGG